MSKTVVKAFLAMLQQPILKLQEASRFRKRPDFFKPVAVFPAFLTFTTVFGVNQQNSCGLEELLGLGMVGLNFCSFELVFVNKSFLNTQIPHQSLRHVVHTNIFL